MRVIINATNIGNKFDGIGIYSLNLLIGLAKLDTDIDFEIFLNRNSEPHIGSLKFPQNFSIKWVNKSLSPDYRFKGHLSRLIHSNLLSLKYRRYLIFNTSQLEAIFLKSNQIITIHDVIPLLFKQHHEKQYYYYKYMLKHALNKASAVITPSSHTKELVQSFYKIRDDKVHVIYNGIQESYLKEIKNYNSHKENFILYVGRMSYTKNITGILKAFGQIINKIDHKLIFVGGGEDYIEKEISRSELFKFMDSKRIIFKGYASNDKILELYKKASLFIFPSFYEGFGFPPLEAMACGCPVVVSNVSSLPEVCGDAAYYVNPYDIESIANGMYKVLTDDALRQNLIKNGLERVKLFNWERSAMEHIKVFEEALDR